MKQNKHNREAAQAALDAVRAFSELPGQEPITGPELLKQNITDLIADLAHLCDREGIALSELIKSAVRHYMEETRNQGTQFID